MRILDSSTWCTLSSLQAIPENFIIIFWKSFMLVLRTLIIFLIFALILAHQETIQPLFKLFWFFDLFVQFRLVLPQIETLLVWEVGWVKRVVMLERRVVLHLIWPVKLIYSDKKAIKKQNWNLSTSMNFNLKSISTFLGSSWFVL